MLSESYIQDAFHSYLKSSLTQAKAERLLDTELLSSAESDLVIIGPALVLYFSALRCTTSPPSVPLPRSSKEANALPFDLSVDNCPPQFLSFLTVWSNNVPIIQALSPEHQHDLARIICGLEPVSQPREPSLQGIGADFRAVAIEISQRRSFQDRYASDLQAAIDSGPVNGTSLRVKASFVPPPMYELSPTSSTQSSPSRTPTSLPSSPRRYPQPLEDPALLSPRSIRRAHSRTPSSTSSTTSSPSSPSWFESSPAITIIRETLYAAIADVLAQHPSIRTLLATDPARAYFSSVAHAILAMSATAITPQGSVIGVMGQELTLADCPRALKPFMMEFAAIGRQAQEMRDEDDAAAIEAVTNDLPIPETRLDRVHDTLIHGVRHSNGRRTSIEGRATAFANRINALALGMTRLPQFRERQKDVFKVLSGVS